MLKGISPLISPEMLKVLDEMGHQDKLIIADANFPAHRYEKYGVKVIRADGHNVPEILDAVLQLYPLDTYTKYPVKLMQLAPGDVGKVQTPIWDVFKKIIKKHDKRGAKAIGTIERMEFYETCKNVQTIILTSETAIYATLILDKGLV